MPDEILEEKPVNYEREYNMDNSGSGVSYNASDLLGIQAMTSGNRGSGYGGGGAWGGGGGGGLYTGNNVLAAEAHANGTAINAKIEGNNSAIRDLGMDFENATRDRQVSDIKETVTTGHDRIVDRLNVNEINALRDKADTVQLINDKAAAAEKCCCDAKLQNCKDHAELMALTISENGKTRELIQSDALEVARARITQLETITALSNNGHRGG